MDRQSAFMNTRNLLHESLFAWGTLLLLLPFFVQTSIATTYTNWGKVHEDADFQGTIHPIVHSGSAFAGFDVNNRALWRSTDGLAWTHTIGVCTGIQKNAGIFAEGKMIMVGRKGINGSRDLGSLLTSTDGEIWTEHAFNSLPDGAVDYDTGDEFYAVTYANGRFVAIGFGWHSGYASHALVVVSEDGTTWDQHVLSLGTDQPSAIPRAIAYGNGTYVMAGSYMSPWISTNGTNWVRSSETDGTYLPNMSSPRLFFMDGFFVALGSDFGTTDNFVTCSAAWSSDGETWIQSKDRYSYGAGVLTDAGILVARQHMDVPGPIELVLGTVSASGINWTPVEKPPIPEEWWFGLAIDQAGEHVYISTWDSTIWRSGTGTLEEDTINFSAMDIGAGELALTLSCPSGTEYYIESAPAVTGTWTTAAGPKTAPSNFVMEAMSFGQEAAQFYRLADGPNFPTPPAGMVLIPAGSFVMGNATNVFSSNEGYGDELPQHTVYVSAFYMDIYEVTKALWDEVKAYNGGNGYEYTFSGLGKATNHPVYMVEWYDMVKWCNARSQRDGLTPVYYTDESFTTLYKSGKVEPFANWSANGYRLPTEAEWEKAARGGAANTRFPWTDYTNKISWAKANYPGNSNEISYDLSGGDQAYHPTFATGEFPYTSPVGYFAPNGYGLHDMAGNMLEWCWDWYSSTYYSNSPATDPRGPSSGVARVMRGGSWYYVGANLARVADRTGYSPNAETVNFGFRCARGL